MNFKDEKTWFQKIVEEHPNNVPSRKSQRTEEEVNQLKAKAEAKREIKRNKRIKNFK